MGLGSGVEPFDMPPEPNAEPAAQIPLITLTAKAIEKVQTLQAEDELECLMRGVGVRGSTFLRVGVRTGGCSGFSYDLFFDFNEPQEGDWIKDCEGVKIVVDRESAPKLAGCVIDFKEGLQGSGFVFDNPGASRTCGCGQSWS